MTHAGDRSPYRAGRPVAMIQLLPLPGFAVGMSITPGPNNIVVASSAASYGVAATMPHMLGIAFGFTATLVMVASGAAAALLPVRRNSSLLSATSGGPRGVIGLPGRVPVCQDLRPQPPSLRRRPVGGWRQGAPACMRYLALPVLVCVSACSPYGFQQEVTAFGSGVDRLSGGFNAGYTNLAADRVAQTRLALTDARAKVAIAASCGVPVGDLPQSRLPCALYKAGGPAPSLMDVQKTRADTQKVLTVLGDYAHALVAVTNASDRTAFDAAVGRLSGSVAGLAAVAGAAAPGAGALAPAAVNLVGWVFGTALDQERFDTLKRGVNAAAGPVRSIATTLGIGLEAIDDARRMVLYEEARDLVARLGPSLGPAAYQQRLGQAEAMIGVLDGLRQADPAGAAASLAKAHDALVAAVNDPRRNEAALVKAIGTFLDQAAAVQAALSASPGSPPPGKPGGK